MLCRKALLVYLGLLGPLAGCVPSSTTEQKGAIAEKDAEQIAKKPGTYVAFGDFRASASFAKETPPESQQNFREEARLSYLKAIEIDPKHVPAYIALARLQQASKDYAAAMGTYKKALTITERDAVLWFELGMCQARQQIWSDAVNSLNKACSLSPNKKEYQSTLGYTLARAGRFNEGLAVLTRTLGEAQANYDLARMLVHLNQPAQARRHVTAALALAPKLPGAAELLAQIDGKTPEEPAAAAGNKPDATPGPLPVILTGAPARQASGGQPRSQNSSAEEPSSQDLRVPPMPVIPIRSTAH